MEIVPLIVNGLSRDQRQRRLQKDLANPEEKLEMIQPSPGLRLAMDPRIPDEYESFLFRLRGVSG